MSDNSGSIIDLMLAAESIEENGENPNEKEKRRRVDWEENFIQEKMQKKSKKRKRITKEKLVSIEEQDTSTVSGGEEFLYTNQMKMLNSLKETPSILPILYSPAFRKWCYHEFFYSTLDTPFFHENEFLACLTHLSPSPPQVPSP